MACLGWFVHAFASTESMLFRLLVEKAGLEPEAGAAVFSGVRMKTAMDAVNRLLESRGMDDEKSALERPFGQLGIISAVRDDILHYGTEEDDFGELFVTNAVKKHLPHRIVIRTVSSVDLLAMTYDLREIELHFVGSMLRTSGSDSEMASLYASWRFAEPWQYKPPAPPPRPETKRGKTRRRKAPLPASRG